MGAQLRTPLPFLAPPHHPGSLAWLPNWQPGKQVMLFLDFDGTLTQIVPHPDSAYLSAEMRIVLSQLTQRYQLIFVSGRKIDDLKKRVGLEEVIYIGSHGFDIEGPDFRRQEGQNFIPLIAIAEEYFQHRLLGIQGLLIENKTFTLALHFRQVDQLGRQQLDIAVAEFLAEQQDLCRGDGKHVIEIRPAMEWDKGAACLWVLNNIKSPASHFPIYIGDDLTDEDAFFALSPRGLTFLVSSVSRKSHAHYRLNDPGAVAALLQKLI